MTVAIVLCARIDYFMQTKVLITIDTENSSQGKGLSDAFDRFVLGRVGNQEYGVYWMADLMKSFGFSGDFFLDVYGGDEFAGSPYPSLCERLLKGGHGIQLHTHPVLMYDPKRGKMHQYSLEEQTAIIRDGMALLKDLTGKMPAAHRAGGYGANEDTLRALHANGIYCDSSFLYDNTNCKLPLGKSNAPTKLHGVWEVPVTVVPRNIRRLGFPIPWFKRYRKLDVNGMLAPDLRRAVMELHGKIPYIVTFLHSFSFIRREGNDFVCNQAAISSFRGLLQLLAEKCIPVASFNEVAAEIGTVRDYSNG